MNPIFPQSESSVPLRGSPRNRALPSSDLRYIFEAVGSRWEDLRNARILFTGASGFFGSWMLESLLHADEHLGLGVRCLAVTRSRALFAEKLPHLASRPCVEVVEADAATLPVPTGPVDYVVHSLVPDIKTPLPEMDRFFQSATGRLLDIAVQKSSRAFLLCSTGAVYQPKVPPAPFSEDDPLVPLDGLLSYGQIRRRVEDQCHMVLDNTPTALKIARGFAFAGPRLPLDANFAVGNFLRDAITGGPIIVKSDGSSIRSYMYAADMATWLWLILFNGPPGRPFNVGSAEPITIGDLAHHVGSLFNVTLQTEGEPLPGSAPSSYIPVTSRAESELRMFPGISLGEGIEKMARWHNSENSANLSR